MLDLAPWLDPLDGENPSGESLRDHPSFHEIERLMQPRVEVTRDDRNNPVAQTVLPVDWTAVLGKAEELRRRGRDLRLLAIVARALANERGLAGLADGLSLIAGTVETHWETVHPELRPIANPRDAALRRINAILQLQDGEAGALGDLRRTVFFTARGLGPITGSDLELGGLDVRTVLASAPGLSEKERAERAAQHEALIARVRTACLAHADLAPQEAVALSDAAAAALAALDAVERALAERVGGPVQLPELRRFLERMRTTLDRPGAAVAPAGAAAAPALSEAPPPAAPAVPAAGGLPDRLASREEVIACLDRIIEFYDRTEPASPVPFLARRMRRMVPMDFLELMEDLAPSGLKEFRALAGLGDDRKANARTQGERT